MNPSWEGPVKFQNLHLSAKQWVKANEEDRIKYFMYVHVPLDTKVFLNMMTKTGRQFKRHSNKSYYEPSILDCE